MIDEKLETLITVAECKNFTRASELLNLTQPAVSHHINQLEKEIGAKLFIRGKEIKITKEGEIALIYAKRMMNLEQKMLRKIVDEKNNITRLTIGVTHSSENTDITELLAKYANDHPNVTISLITDNIKNLYDKLENYELDLAIVEGKRLSNKLNYLMLDTDYLVAVVGNTNELAKKSSIKLEELKNQNMILRLPGSATRELFEASLISNNESIHNFNVSLEVDSINTIKTLVKKGLGVSILSKSSCLYDAKKNKLKILPIQNLTMMREINIVYNKDFHQKSFLDDIYDLYQNNIANK